MLLVQKKRNHLSKYHTGATQKMFRFINWASLVSLLLLINSCNNYSGPSIETLGNYRFNYLNSNGIAMGGEYLNDSIYVQIQNLISPSEVNGFNVEFHVISGGGSVDQQEVVTDNSGKAATRWKLGTESFKQVVTVRIYGPEGKFLPEVNMYAYGILPNSWNDVDIQPLSQLSDLAADTVNHISWMISVSKLYKRGTNFLDWHQLYDTGINSAREIEIDKNGVVYVGTWYGELFKSIDHGQTWIKCTNPIPDRPYYFYFWITSDGDLWATVYERGLWHSNDGGTTWSNPNDNFTNGVFRLKNGSLISLVSPIGEGQSVMKSEDDGKTWLPLSTPDYPYSLFVTDNDEIIVFTQGNGGIYKSVDLGNTYKLVHTSQVAFNSGSMQSYVHKFESYYYMAIPGYGVLKTQNFEQFETILNEPYIGGLYVDHTGSVVASGTLEKLYYTFYYNKE